MGSRKYRKNIDIHNEEHDKKLNTRTFNEGEKVLLKVKDFEIKKSDNFVKNGKAPLKS
jgi:hypothetical protein